MLMPRPLPNIKAARYMMAMVSVAANKLLSRLNIAQTVAQTGRM